MSTRTLPWLPLVLVLERELEPLDFGHGGVVARWDSHETSRTMALVCKDWEEAGTWVLYRSIAVFGLVSAELLVRTLRARPDLGLICESLVLGVGEDMEVSLTDTGQREASLVLVEVLNFCSEVRHLQVSLFTPLLGTGTVLNKKKLPQIRPLHESVHDSLLAAITSKPRLVSLIVAPRLTHQNAGWTSELFQPADLHRLALPSLHHLELNVWAADARRRPPTLVPELKLRALRLFATAPVSVTFALLQAASSLEFLELYTESSLPVDDLVAALRHSTSTMQRVLCVSNPGGEDTEFDPHPVPAFDQLLPDYHQLVYLEVSSTEISPNAFTRLPPSLRHLGIRSYFGAQSSAFSAELLQVLRIPGLVLFLESVTVADDHDGWDVDAVAQLTSAFARRGITFTFKLNLQL